MDDQTVEVGRVLLNLVNRIDAQVPVTRAYLVENGISAHFADILLSHYRDFSREARAALSAATVSHTKEEG